MTIDSDLTKIRRSTNRIQKAYTALETQAGDLLTQLTLRTEERDDARHDHSVSTARVAELEAEVKRLTDLLEQDPWEPLYSTVFAVNDEWKASTISKAHDDARALPHNVHYTPGGLLMDAKRETTTSSTGTRHFTSSEIQGRHIEIGNYFRAAVRASAPSIRGLRPCPLWFRPLNGNDGEIDAMENFGGQPRAMATLHTEYGTNHRMIHGPLRWPKAADAVYDYVIEKTPGRILITIDGHTLLDAGPASPNGVPAGWPWDRIFENPDRTWYPRISVEVGCGNRAGCDTGTPPADFRAASMHVESLQIWNRRAA